jgi:PAS domain S-box-containing protein
MFMNAPSDDADGKSEMKDALRGEGLKKQTSFHDIHESYDIYRLIVESAEDFAIFTLDLDGKITTWSAGAELILQYSADEIVGKDASIIFTDEDRDADIMDKEIHDALYKGRASDERWHMRKDGSLFWADGLMMPLQDSMTKVQGFLKIVRDRTRYRNLEEKMMTLEKELADLKGQKAQ